MAASSTLSKTITVNCYGDGEPVRLSFSDSKYTLKDVKRRLSELWAVEPILLTLSNYTKEELKDDKLVHEIVESGEAVWAAVKGECFLRKKIKDYGRSFTHVAIEEVRESSYYPGDEVTIGESNGLSKFFGDGWKIVRCVARGGEREGIDNWNEFDVDLEHGKPYDLPVVAYENYLDIIGKNSTTAAVKFSFEGNWYVSIPCLSFDAFDQLVSGKQSKSDNHVHHIAFILVEETVDYIHVKSGSKLDNTETATPHPLDRWQQFLDQYDEDQVMGTEIKYSPTVSSIWEEHQKRLIGCVVQQDGMLAKARRMDEGIYVIRGTVNAEKKEVSNCYTGLSSPSKELVNRLNQQIDKLKYNEPPDYHPGSNNVVRDLVHPSMFPYVKPTSAVEEKAKVVARDFWGRPYEDSRYQWLPSEFHIDQDSGRCVIKSYINNLNRSVYGDLYVSLAELFNHALPLLEACYFEYCTKVQNEFIENALDPDNEDYKENYEDTDVEDEFSEDKAPLPKSQSFNGMTLQVIPKIVDYELGPDQIHEGVWHVEGMSHENIVATALYILDKDADLVGGNLLFKRAYLSSEVGKICYTVPQSRPYSWNDMIYEDLQPLGTVVLPKGTLAVWPNSHVHRLTKLCSFQMENNDTPTTEEKQEQEGTTKQPPAKQQKQEILRRRIIVFWLVNPVTRITSTKDVPPQQGKVPLAKALETRLALMEERKRHKQEWNIRTVSLCEH